MRGDKARGNDTDEASDPSREWQRAGSLRESPSNAAP
jgi:hypothetical protein